VTSENECEPDDDDDDTRERVRTTSPPHAESPGNAHAVLLTLAYGEQRCARARCRATTKVAREKDAPPSQRYNTIADNGDGGDDQDDGTTTTTTTTTDAHARLSAVRV